MASTSLLQVILGDCVFTKSLHFFLGVQLKSEEGTEYTKFRTDVSEVSDRPEFQHCIFTFDPMPRNAAVLYLEAFIVVREAAEGSKGQAKLFGRGTVELTDKLDRLRLNETVSETVEFKRRSKDKITVVGTVSVLIKHLDYMMSPAVPKPIGGQTEEALRTRYSCYVYGAENVLYKDEIPNTFLTFKSTRDVARRQRSAATTRVAQSTSSPMWNAKLGVALLNQDLEDGVTMFIGFVNADNKRLIDRITLPVVGLLPGRQHTIACRGAKTDAILYFSFAKLESIEDELALYQERASLYRLEVHLNAIDNVPNLRGHVFAVVYIAKEDAPESESPPFEFLACNDTSAVEDYLREPPLPYKQFSQVVLPSHGVFDQRFVFALPAQQVFASGATLWIDYYFRPADVPEMVPALGYTLCGRTSTPLRTATEVKIPKDSRGVEVPLPELLIEGKNAWGDTEMSPSCNISIRLRSGQHWLEVLQKRNKQGQAPLEPSIKQQPLSGDLFSVRPGTALTEMLQNLPESELASPRELPGDSDMIPVAETARTDDTALRQSIRDKLGRELIPLHPESEEEPSEEEEGESDEESDEDYESHREHRKTKRILHQTEQDLSKMTMLCKRLEMEIGLLRSECDNYQLKNAQLQHELEIIQTHDLDAISVEDAALLGREDLLLHYKQLVHENAAIRRDLEKFMATKRKLANILIQKNETEKQFIEMKLAQKSLVENAERTREALEGKLRNAKRALKSQERVISSLEAQIKKILDQRDKDRRDEMDRTREFQRHIEDLKDELDKEKANRLEIGLELEKRQLRLDSVEDQLFKKAQHVIAGDHQVRSGDRHGHHAAGDQWSEERKYLMSRLARAERRADQVRDEFMVMRRDFDAQMRRLRDQADERERLSMEKQREWERTRFKSQRTDARETHAEDYRRDGDSITRRDTPPPITDRYRGHKIGKTSTSRSRSAEDHYEPTLPQGVHPSAAQLARVQTVGTDLGTYVESSHASRPTATIPNEPPVDVFNSPAMVAPPPPLPAEDYVTGGGMGVLSRLPSYGHLRDGTVHSEQSGVSGVGTSSPYGSRLAGSALTQIPEPQDPQVGTQDPTSIANLGGGSRVSHLSDDVESTPLPIMSMGVSGGESYAQEYSPEKSASRQSRHSREGSSGRRSGAGSAGSRGGRRSRADSAGSRQRWSPRVHADGTVSRRPDSREMPPLSHQRSSEIIQSPS